MEAVVFWFSIMACFSAAYISQTLTLSALFGSFTLGLLGIPRIGIYCHSLKTVLEPLGDVILLPVFFAYSGLRTDWTLLTEESVSLAFLFLGAVYFTKFVASWVVAWWLGMRGFKTLYYSILMTCKGLTVLAMLNICLSVGIITSAFFFLCCSLFRFIRHAGIAAHCSYSNSG